MTEDTNVTAVAGRLARDAELKRDGGQPVGFFTVASNRKKKDGAGNYAEEASYIDIVVYGRYAETITPMLKQGAKVCVTGRLKQERWTDRESGQNRSRIVVTAESVQIFR